MPPQRQSPERTVPPDDPCPLTANVSVNKSGNDNANHQESQNHTWKMSLMENAIARLNKQATTRTQMRGPKKANGESRNDCGSAVMRRGSGR